VSLIDGVCRRDPERWEEFDRIYRPILFGYLRKLHLNETDADNVIQDVYVKLLAKIHTYNRTKCRFRTWLFRVTQNTLIDHVRRKACQQKVLEGWAVHVLAARPSDSAKMNEGWNQIHREKILAHAFKVVRARVSRTAWACFEQRMLRDRPAAEIAPELNIEREHVYVHTCRVMKRVREVCEEFDEDIGDRLDSDAVPMA
jgi:RNA polymerase sigma-70 factor (ECF subfamily)